MVPLQPFMGIMAVAPMRATVGQPGITVEGVQTTRPPGPFGGNLDFKDLTTGATLFLPVFQRGAQFYVGDPHSVQGDGEVNGTAVEHSLTGTFRLILHKKRALAVPRAETATHYVVMGIDVDLDRAMRIATQEAVDFCSRRRGSRRPTRTSWPASAATSTSPRRLTSRRSSSGKFRRTCFDRPRASRTRLRRTPTVRGSIRRYHP